MEDFVREINRASSVFLLYGNDGVGKSRLLRQLTSLRLSEFNIHWIDFRQPNESGEGDMAAQITRTAEVAGQDDIIVLDHFEEASNKAQHQIFQSWSTEGKDKSLNVIIATSNDGFKPFRQLAQQFQIEARSFQLMPCSLEEAEAYLQYSIFPEQPLGEMNITHPIKKRIRGAKGVFTQLNEIILRDAGSFSIKSESPKSALMRTSYSIGFLALVLLLVGVVYWQSIAEQTIETPESEIVVVDKIDTKIEDETENAPTVKQEPVIAEAPVEPELPVPVIEEPTTIEVVEAAEENETAEVSPQEALDDIQVNWLQALLETSLEWIVQNDQRRGTIQIMSIGFDNLNPSSFQEYIIQLESKGVDISQIRVFRTMAQERIVYSIFYGEYESRLEADRQIKNIPDALRANSPIPRTLGRIAQEIGRLQDATGDN